MHAAVLVTPPARVVELATLKDHLRILHSQDDLILETYLDTAIQHLDGPRGVLGRCMVTQSWRQDFDAWQDVFRLPVPDVQSVTLRYIDAAGVEQTVAAEAYRFDNAVEAGFLHLEPDFVRPELGRRTAGVRITIVAGFGAPSAVPVPLVSAVLIHAAHLYEHRGLVASGQVQMLPMTHDALIAPWRRGLV